MSTAVISASGDPVEYAIAAWLHSKTTRACSAKTARAYTDTLQRFRWALQHVGLDLDADAARVADMAQAWCAQPWGTRRAAVTANTYNQRLAIVSSFYVFARKRRILAENPMELVDRRPVGSYEGARPLDAVTVSEALAAIDRTKLIGLRDYALLSIALYTGRRLSELVNMTWGNIEWARHQATVTFPRAKGGKKMYDTLSLPISHALDEYIKAAHPEPVASTVIWISLAHNHYGTPLSRQAVSDICLKRLGTSKVHTTRHTFALGMVKSGAPVNAIQARLGHANLSTTSRYLTVLQSAENEYGGALAAPFGLDK